MAADTGGRRGFLRNVFSALRDSFFAPPPAPDVSNRYEAAYQSYDRSWLPAAVQDARFDADGSTRLELVRRSRYWERNNAIVNRLADVFEQYTVGPGLQLIPSCTDEDGKPLEDFNLSGGRWWGDWCKSPDVASSLSFGALQGQMARALFVDGEIFIYKTYSRENGKPRIQLIESHRIATPPHLSTQEGKGIIDGIEFAMDQNGSPVGRPKRYWVRVDSSPAMSAAFGRGIGASTGVATWEPIEGDRIIHLFEPSRPGMVRSLPYLYPVMNDLHDLDDLQALEMKAAKNNAEIANVVTNKTGEANVSTARRQRWQINSQDAAGAPTVKTPPLFYEMSVGGRTVYISNGEKFEQFRSDRPGAGTREYWDYLVRKICAGVGISALLVLPFSLQGTVTRADLDAAAAFFRCKSALIASALREIYVWVMGWAVRFDRSLDGAPKEWWPVSSRPPRSVNVDVGRNSYAIIKELESGIRTYQDVCGELGYDWRDVLRQKAIEAAYIDGLVKEFGVQRDQIVKLGLEDTGASQTQGEHPPKKPATPEEEIDGPPAPTEPASAQDYFQRTC